LGVAEIFGGIAAGVDLEGDAAALEGCANSVDALAMRMVQAFGDTQDGGEAAGYVLHLPDKRAIYFAGDTAVFSDMALIEQLYRPDLAFLPIGDLFTMSPKEAALACSLLQPKKVVPMHFGTFPALTGRPEELAELAKPSGVEVWPLEPGETVRW